MTEARAEPAAVRVEAPAKVNLYLRVVGRRADGYHLLDSLVVFPAAGDSIAVGAADGPDLPKEPGVIARRQRRRSNPEPPDLDRHAAVRLATTASCSGSPGLSLAVSGPFAADVPDGDDNLVLRAARLLAEAAGAPARAHIRLIKRLPVASGIGGGSADAAATLLALARLWRLDPDVVDLSALALRLGADVPMCLAGRPVFVGGIGEEIAPAPPLPAFALLLANPGVAVATPAVFAGRRGGFSMPCRFQEAPADAAALAALLAPAGNDLTEAALAVAPEIREVLAALAAQPGTLLCRMSGSGATCFALFAEEAQAEAARRALAARYPDWWLEAAPVASSGTGQG